MTRPLLVVDDNAITRTLAADLLREEGFEAARCGSAEKALARVRGDPPALCIVGNVVQGMSGADFVRAVRASADARLRTLPLLGLTSGSPDELLRAGANACLQKPYRAAELTSTIRRLLSLARR